MQFAVTDIWVEVDAHVYYTVDKCVGGSYSGCDGEEEYVDIYHEQYALHRKPINVPVLTDLDVENLHDEVDVEVGIALDEVKNKAIDEIMREYGCNSWNP